MSRLAELGVAKRLALIVFVGALAVGANTTIGLLGQKSLAEKAAELRALEAAQVAIHHLETRQAELKSDAYRAALGQEVAGDVVNNVAGLRQAAEAVTATALPADLAGTFAGVRPDVDAFGTFITTFVQAAGQDAGSVRGRLGEVAQRNGAVVDKLGALDGQLDPAIQAGGADMDDAVARTRLTALSVAGVSVALLVLFSIPLLRSVLRPAPGRGRRGALPRRPHPA